MSMESANTALAEMPESFPQNQVLSQNGANAEGISDEIHSSEASATELVNLERRKTLPFRERDKSDRFARDINAKIDALEEQLGRSATTLERSQEMIKAALEELRDRIMGVRMDTNERLETNRDEIKANRAEIEAQRNELKDTRAEIQTNRDEIKNQSYEISAHHTEIQSHRDAIMAGHVQLKTQLDELNDQRATIKAHRTEIDTHRDSLKTQGEAIKTHATNLSAHQQHLATHSEKIAALDDQHVDMQQVMKAFSLEHDVTAAKVDELADQLYDANAQSAEHRQLTQKNFRILTGALVGTTLLTLSLFTYFQFNPMAAPAAVETQLSALNTGLEQQRLATESLSGEVLRLNNGITTLESSVSQLGTTQSALRADYTHSAEEIGQMHAKLGSFEVAINDLRARIQRSLGARTPIVAPTLPLNDAQWIAGRNPEHYVIQVVGVHEYDSLVRFVNKNASEVNKFPLSYSTSTHLGKDWHNLMYGDFANFSDAKAALESLPPAMLVNRPWIRKMSTVQKNVRR